MRKVLVRLANSDGVELPLVFEFWGGFAMIGNQVELVVPPMR